jgi:hypothetical protein
MSAAQALAGLKAPRRPCLTLVAPAPPARSWEAPKRFREPEAALLATFLPDVHELLGYAEVEGLRAAWFTFTSRIKVDRSRAGRERVRQDLKRRWSKFRNSAAWRKVPGALVIFATHGRPHVHVLAVMPEKMPLRAIYGAWTGGFTDCEPASTGDAEALARYCAAQRDRSLGNVSAPHRFFTFRRPPPAHLDCRAPAPSQVLISPVLPAGWRADAGGGASLGEVRPEGHHGGPSVSEAPKAAATVGEPAGGPEPSAAPPHRMSEPYLRLVPTPPPEVTTMMQPPPPSYADRFTRADVELAMVALRAVLPRQREGAICIMSLASAANLDWKLTEEAPMRLLFVNQVKRKKDRKAYIYWAGKTLPAPVPVVVPQRLRMFMPPPWFGPRP